MKKILTVLILVCLFKLSFAQTNEWFSTYSDSTTLVTDANKIVQQMTERVIKLNPAIKQHKTRAIKNTTPYLIFIDSTTVNLPFWEEVIAPQKKFFSEVAGGEKEGKEVFGLLFNGFFLAHELGHSFSASSGKKFDNNYDSEYDANTIAILYWRAAGEKENLKKCYDYAQKMLKTLKNPVPENEDYKKYITENYNRLASDPYKYGYIQFSQFVEIYENKILPDFDTYIKNYQEKQ